MEEGGAEGGLDLRVIRMPPHPKKRPHTSPQFWICGGSEGRPPGLDQKGSITTRPKELRLNRPAVDWVIVLCTAAALVGAADVIFYGVASCQPQETATTGATIPAVGLHVTSRSGVNTAAG